MRPEIVQLLKTATVVFIVYFLVYSIFLVGFFAVYTDYGSHESLEIVQRREIKFNATHARKTPSRKHGLQQQREPVDVELTLSQLAPNFRSLREDCYFDLDRCFDVYRCVNYEMDSSAHADIQQISRLRVHVYEPTSSSSVGLVSSEFLEFVQTILDSEYYEPDANKACLFVPFIDFFNENNLNTNESQSYFKTRKTSSGRNHLVFNMVRRASLEMAVEYQADLVTSPLFFSSTIRNGFDVSVPLFNPATARMDFELVPSYVDRKYLVSFTQLGAIDSVALETLTTLSQRNPEKLFMWDRSCAATAAERSMYLSRCPRSSEATPLQLSELMSSSVFCLVVQADDQTSAPLAFFDAIKFNCIPIVVADEWILPFSERIDWYLHAVQVRRAHLPGLVEIVDEFMTSRAQSIDLILKRLRRIHLEHFASIGQITRTLLEVIEARVFPVYARSYESWNFKGVGEPEEKSPFLIRFQPDLKQGFTAVVLARSEPSVVNRLMNQVLLRCRHLRRILVLWHGDRSQQHLIQSRSSDASVGIFVRFVKPSNLNRRFWQFKDIVKTEALLYVDETTQLDTSQVDRAFELWRESYSDRLLGFDTQLVSWEKPRGGRLQFETLSLKAFFSHSYFNYHFGLARLSDLRAFVQNNNECMDVAFGLLVRDLTSQSSVVLSFRNSTFPIQNVDFCLFNSLKYLHSHQSDLHDRLLDSFSSSKLVVKRMDTNSKFSK